MTYINRKRTRISFAVWWSVFTVMGVCLHFSNVPFGVHVLGSLLGFHVPQCSLYYTVLFGYFMDRAEWCLLWFLILAVFLVLWIVALVRINRSGMFEYLILGDRITALGMLILTSIVSDVDFSIAWIFYAVLALEIFLCGWLLRRYKKPPTRQATSA